MKEALLSIDLGTTSVKVAAFAPDGVLYQQLTRRHTDHSSGERTWQDANSWWEDVAGLMRELLAGLTPCEILGVSLSGRGGAAVFTDGGVRFSHIPGRMPVTTPNLTSCINGAMKVVVVLPYMGFQEKFRKNFLKVSNNDTF